MLTKGEQKIILFLYQATKLHDKLIERGLEELGTSREQIKKHGFSLPPTDFHIPIRILRSAGIYKHAKIYTALDKLQKDGLIVKCNKPYPFYSKAVSRKMKNGLTEKKYRRSLQKDLEKADPNDFLFLEFIGKNAGLDLDVKKLKEYTKQVSSKTLGKDPIEVGIRFLKDTGLLWYPNQKFVYLTPDGMFLGKILERLSEQSFRDPGDLSQSKNTRNEGDKIVDKTD
jgi:hypothetical protein